ncbi:alpha-2-macroglobulin-like protein 1 isoform X2 [Mixophyes fleayi]|uniref:alpha-2-macroglobulin-like protein 1 isoform X2 n=1 Tax=Mixophyes fleayi TaxID=3061075 RepID=UPI003F4DBAA6
MEEGLGTMMRLLCLLLSLEVTLVLSDDLLASNIPGSRQAAPDLNKPLSPPVTAGESDKNRNYAVFISPDLYYPSKDKFCICISNPIGFLNVSVDLKTSSGTITLYRRLPNHPIWHCESFQVPEPAGDTEKVEIEVHEQEIGGNKLQLATKTVTIWRKSIGTLIQTDKSVYKPGQKVNIRMVKVYQDMEICNDNYPLVELQDPQKNRLAQWKDVAPNNGIVDLEYQMSPEPLLGLYTIKAGDTSIVFGIEEYVLPKFEVLTDIPKQLSILDKNISMSVYGKYTYGEIVPGKVTLKVCQKQARSWWYYWPRRYEEEEEKHLCYTEVAKTDQSGKLQTVVSLSHFKVRDSGYSRQLEVEATLEEEGTEVKLSASSKQIDIKSEITKLSFKDSKSYFQPGAPYRGKLVLESYDGKPLGGQKVHLTTSFTGQTIKETFITDSAGEVSFHLPTSEWGKNSVTLRATSEETNESYDYNKISVRYGQSRLYLKDIHVEAKDSVYICPVKSSAQRDQDVMVTVNYTFEEKDNRDIFYLVLANGKITYEGKKTVEGIDTDSLSGSVEFSIPVRNISPSGKLLVFTMSKSGGVAADTTTAQVTPFLNHEAILWFSEDEVLPASDVKLHLKANGGSMCAVRAVDKSVVLMKPEAELTESKIQNLVQIQRTYISNRLDYSLCQGKTPQPSQSDSDSSDFWIYDPWMWRSSYPEKKKDIQDIIQEMGLLILSNWKIVAPVTCKPYGEIQYIDYSETSGLLGSFSLETAAMPMEADDTFDDSAPEDSDGEASGETTVRTNFPETWIWCLHPVNLSGHGEISVTVPDTITEWSAQMFCAGPGGLGLSQSVTLKAFQPLFVDMTLPYSVKQGESFTLKATVSNYMSHPTKILTTLPPSNEFAIKNNIANEDPFCLSGGERKTLSWVVTPKIIGKMNISVIAEAVSSQDLCGGKETIVPQKGKRDVMIQSLLVEPEGTLVEQTHNSMLLCEGNSVSEKVKLELPSSHVPGSEKAFLSISGDIMGPAMNNLDHLLAMSSGCGEQNMVRFAPNVYVLQFLKTSDQLSPDILKKGKGFLESGLQRQLTYKHPDGCYSAFGKSDPEGSTWLTAFVLKSFCQGKDFMFIDENHINQGLDWLKQQQKPNGCFKTKGRVLHNAMKGGVDDEISLTAYVTAALLECFIDPSDPVVQNALQCIKNQSLDKASPYKLALLSYAFTLAKRTELRDAVMKKLEEQATKTDGLMYWTQEAKPDTDDSYWSKPLSVDVEMTGYVLLSMSSKEQTSKKELGDMMASSRWLCKQQNANGGFSSTQDTVVAIQAMSKFASLTSANIGGMTVEVTTEKGFQHQFQVDNDNRLLLQKATLTDIPGEYTVTATGNGTVFMQVVQRYHTPPSDKEAPFELSAESVCVKREESNFLEIKVQIRYTGKRPSSNMALVEVKMLSGYVPKEDCADQLKKKPLVKRVETSEDLVIIYIDKVTSEPQTLEIVAKQIVPVTDLKPAIIKVFDYYLPDEKKTIDYLNNCS